MVSFLINTLESTNPESMTFKSKANNPRRRRSGGLQLLPERLLLERYLAHKQPPPPRILQ
jgi:hypothetical protein